MRDAQAELEMLVRSRHPLVAVETSEESRVHDLVQKVATSLKMPLLTWSTTSGLRREGEERFFANSLELISALDHAERFVEPAIFLFRDLPSFLEEVRIVRRVLDVRARFEGQGRTLILLGAELDLPKALREVALDFVLPLPDPDELRALAWRVVRDFSRDLPVKVLLTKKQLDELLASLEGLTTSQAERALCSSIADDLALTKEDLPRVLEAKRDVLKQQGVLEYVPSSVDMAAVGGLTQLKAWIGKRRDAFGAEAKAFGLPAPKGVVLLGVQGCGKSLAAKAIAADWALPLLRLEAGRLYDKYIGESDKNLERALDAATRMAPCVLWIDEIEKAFSYAGSADSDGGLSRRIFGRLLSWLQEKTAPVFVVATCNDVESLPPELMRKGRFDEIFFVDLPREEERRAIFRVHLARRDRDPVAFDLKALGRASGGFSGAEIEQAVVAGLYTAFAAKHALDSEILLSELGATKPLSVTRSESVAALRRWADGRAVPA